jgi:hypothetical protein
MRRHGLSENLYIMVSLTQSLHHAVGEHEDVEWARLVARNAAYMPVGRYPVNEPVFHPSINSFSTSGPRCSACRWARRRLIVISTKMANGCAFPVTGTLFFLLCPSAGSFSTTAPCPPVLRPLDVLCCLTPRMADGLLFSRGVLHCHCGTLGAALTAVSQTRLD